ncbi:3-oxo-tetronate kinase [Amaricoccus solimangrovi]|uniref:3-oxo-tetronate kinase n=1 Tax=Amaricoccus solimangrovi TaxID=2589815 RepID=A0A501WRP6_9RHOB|nr:3-oxo-tetronate kinase [Amaricoccus solimangrovi]TPE49671.1 four-carbon acid sugar kinase family protein [Amaricoccus solimangrovi]
MLLGVIADDFTGASDIANTIARGLPGQGGLVTAQFLGVPAGPAGAEVEAGVVALKTRSVPATEAVVQSLEALRWLRAQGCRQIVFKYCSTFDSTPEGNIGPVAEALAEALGASGVVVCPAFPRAGRTLYQGHLFVGDRLLNESGMEHHPLTPMTDADIRRWLARQVRSPIGLVPHDVVREGPTAIGKALARAPERLVVVDAISDADLVAIGAARAGAPFLTGGSGIALGLAANFIAQGAAQGARRSHFPGRPGVEAILAGSCSGATRGQIEYHARRHPVLPISVDAVMAGRVGVNDLLAFLADHAGEAPLTYSSATPDEVLALQDRYGRERVAAALDGLFAETARAFVRGGGRRLVVAGGETSGAVAQALDLGQLMIGPEIAPGVPVLFSAGNSAALALKSGNFGQRDFFEKALGILAEGEA